MEQERDRKRERKLIEFITDLYSSQSTLSKDDNTVFYSVTHVAENHIFTSANAPKIIAPYYKILALVEMNEDPVSFHAMPLLVLTWPIPNQYSALSHVYEDQNHPFSNSKTNQGKN